MSGSGSGSGSGAGSGSGGLPPVAGSPHAQPGTVQHAVERIAAAASSGTPTNAIPVVPVVAGASPAGLPPRRLAVQTSGLAGSGALPSGARTPPVASGSSSTTSAGGSRLPSYLAHVTAQRDDRSFVAVARLEARKEKEKADDARAALQAAAAGGTPHSQSGVSPPFRHSMSAAVPTHLSLSGMDRASTPIAASPHLIHATSASTAMMTAAGGGGGAAVPGTGAGASPLAGGPAVLQRSSTPLHANEPAATGPPPLRSSSTVNHSPLGYGYGSLTTTTGPLVASTTAPAVAAGSDFSVSVPIAAAGAGTGAAASAMTITGGGGASASRPLLAEDAGAEGFIFATKAEECDEEVKEFREPPLAVLASYRYFYLGIGMFAGRHKDEDCEETPHPCNRSFQIAYTGLCLLFVLINVALSLWVAAYEPSTTLKVIIQLLQLAACVSSFGLCYDLLTTRRIEILTFLAIRNTSAKSRVRTEINYALYFNILATLVIGCVGAAADIANITTLMNAELHPNVDPIRSTLGSYGIFLWQVTCVTVNVQAAAGITIFATVANLHMCKVNSCIRALDRAHTDIPHAIDRVLDIDVSLAHFGYKSAEWVNVIFVSHFLKFFLSSMIRATAASFLGNAPFVVLVQSIIHPGSICLYFLSSAGMLNQQALYLTKVCVRFYLKHVNDQNAKNLKDFLEFTKAGDFCMRFNGIRVELADAWKLVAVASSFFFTLLQMQSKGAS